MIRGLLALPIVASYSASAAVVLQPELEIESWVDDAVAGNGIRLEFDKEGTTFSFLRVD